MDDCFVRRVDRSGGNDLMRVRNEQAAVVGAGRMGHGIALELARGGYRVAIFDAKTGRASTAITEAERDASDLVEAGVIGQGDIPKIIQRLSAEADLKTAVTGARVVFEAVAEDLEIKREVFVQLDQLAPVDALLLSNTSSIGISDIAAVCRQPERVALAHWILPPHLLPVVEVAPGRCTSEGTITAVCDLLEGIGKWPIVLKQELPGYLINRLQFAMLREAMDLVDRGVASAEEIDRAICGSISRRVPTMGIFGQADAAGLDVYHQIFRYLAPDLSRSTEPPSVLDRAVKAGHTGASAGQGFYSWTESEIAEVMARTGTDDWASCLLICRVAAFSSKYLRPMM